MGPWAHGCFSAKDPVLEAEAPAAYEPGLFEAPPRPPKQIQLQADLCGICRDSEKFRVRRHVAQPSFLDAARTFKDLGS